MLTSVSVLRNIPYTVVRLLRAFATATTCCTPSLVVPPADQAAVDLLPTLRRAIRAGRCLVLRYRDEQGRETERRVWPFGLVYFDQVRLLAAWCELRGDFRHFRADRIAALTETGERYPQRRQALLQKWQEIECKGPF